VCEAGHTYEARSVAQRQQVAAGSGRRLLHPRPPGLPAGLTGFPRIYGHYKGSGLTPDQINSGFEFAATAAAIFNIMALLKHREVRGVSIASMASFTVWGIWNMWYYPHLGQTWSAIAAGVLVVANSTWLGLVIYYRKKKGGRVPCSYLEESQPDTRIKQQ